MRALVVCLTACTCTHMVGILLSLVRQTRRCADVPCANVHTGGASATQTTGSHGHVLQARLTFVHACRLTSSAASSQDAAMQSPLARVA